MPSLAVVDTEFFVLPRGGSRRQPLTTMVPFAVAVVLVDVATGAELDHRQWLVRPAGLGPDDATTVAVALSRCRNRHLYRAAHTYGRDCADVLAEARAMIARADAGVWAKGAAMERRFLSGRGLCGEACAQAAALADLTLTVHDLDDPEARAAAEDAGVPVRAVPVGTAHDPLAEVRFFAPPAVAVVARRAGAVV